jgi:hypothetical protein
MARWITSGGRGNWGKKSLPVHLARI